METGNVWYEEKSVVDLEGDCLILPTVADRLDDSNFHEDIYEAAGESVQRSLREDLPLRIGNVSVTGGGELNVNRIVHVPVQTAPDVPTTVENLQVGLRSGLVTADEEGTRTVLMARPVPDDQFDEFNVDEFVGTLHEDLHQYPPAHFREIILCGTKPGWIDSVGEVFESRT